MPVKINKVIAPEIQSAKEQGVTLVKESPTGYFFHMPVVVKDHTIDLTDIPKGSIVTAALGANQEPVLLKVKDGVKVQIDDDYDSRTKIHVLTESGGHSIGRGYVYFANDNKKNINGKFNFDDLVFAGPISEKVVELKEAVYKVSVDFGSDRTIFCRHLANAALAFRHSENPLNWKEARDKYFSLPNLLKTFTNREASESIVFDLISGTESIVNTHRLNLGKTLRAQLKELSKDIQPNETREKKYYVILENPLDLMGINHACAMVLRSKCDVNGEVVHKIKMYDPNITFNHVSFADDSSDLALVADLTFEELFPHADKYSNYKQMRIHELNKDWDMGVTQLTATNNGRNKVTDYIYDEASDKLVVAAEQTLEEHLEAQGYHKLFDKKENFIDEVI